MDKSATEYLLLAEQAMLSTLSKPSQLAEGTYADYQLLKDQLRLANEIGVLRARAASLLEKHTSPSDIKSLASTPIPRSSNQEKKSPSTPSSIVEERAVFFVENDILYKFALGKEDGATVYRRKVPMLDVETCCEAIARLIKSGGPITARKIEQLAGVNPPYKVQVILGALVASGELKHRGRGQYFSKPNNHTDRNRLIESILQLPQRLDWVERFERAKGGSNID